MHGRIATAIAIVLGAAYAADAQAQGPILKRLMPDGGSSSARSSGGMWIPGARLAENTKDAFGGAKDRMWSWRKKQQRETSEFIEGTGRFFRPDLARKEDERRADRPSILSYVRPATWLEPAPEPDPGPQSVHEWIGQPRPGID